MIISLSTWTVLLRIDDVRYPVDCFRNSMVDPRLARLSARVSRRHDSNEVPFTQFFQHQRTTAVSLYTNKSVFVSLKQDYQKKRNGGGESSSRWYVPGTNLCLLLGTRRTSSRRIWWRWFRWSDAISRKFGCRLRVRPQPVKFLVGASSLRKKVHLGKSCFTSNAIAPYF